MYILAIDIGNTSTHYAVLKGTTVVVEARVPTSTIEQLPTYIRSFIDHHCRDFSLSGGSLSSVVPVASQQATKAFKDVGISYIQLTSTLAPQIGLPIERFPHPQEIGQDLLANALGAKTQYGTPAIVIDIGSALTLDVINTAGHFVGGIIAPGPDMFANSLHQRTALLPAIDMKRANKTFLPYGKSTINAMEIGCLVGFSGLVAKLIQHIGQSMPHGQPKHLICTGGMSEHYLHLITQQCIHDPHLTLKGLAMAHHNAWKLGLIS